MTFDLAEFADNHAAWSRRTFGDNRNPAGILDHIRKELREIASKPDDVFEWVDVILLAMDGAARFAGADGLHIAGAIIAKHLANCERTWPTGGDPDHAVEHVRGDAS